MLDATSTEGVDRTGTNALFGDNKLKLGIFGLNCNSGCAMTTAPEGHHLTWDITKKIAIAADKAGFEVLVPVSRWKGLGGENNFNGRNFETYTWAAGLAAITENITLTTTSHVQVMHPILAAKQAATIDHISNGRYALNIVCGWFGPEIEMFGQTFLDHDERYNYTEEWFEIVKGIWTGTETDSFSHNGKYFQIDDCLALPKPLQRPFPAVINAGGSERGRNFIASQCDVGYIVITDHNDLEGTRRQVSEYRELAEKKYNRAIQVWTHAYVIQRDTEAEAKAYLDRITEEYGNNTAADTAAKFLGLSSEIMPAEAWQTFKTHLKAGYGGYGIVGSEEQVAEKLAALSEVGLDGVAVHWVDYDEGLSRFNEVTLPKLEAAGLRKPFLP